MFKNSKVINQLYFNSTNDVIYVQTGMRFILKILISLTTRKKLAIFFIFDKDITVKQQIYFTIIKIILYFLC